MKKIINILINVFLILTVTAALLFKILHINTLSILKDVSTPSEEVVNQSTEEELENYSSIPKDELKRIEKSSVLYLSMFNIAFYSAIFILILKIILIFYNKKKKLT